MKLILLLSDRSFAKKSVNKMAVSRHKVANASADHQNTPRIFSADADQKNRQQFFLARIIASVASRPRANPGSHRPIHPLGHIPSQRGRNPGRIGGSDA